MNHKGKDGRLDSVHGFTGPEICDLKLEYFRTELIEHARRILEADMKRRQREKSRPNTRAETRTETRSENHRSEKNEPKPTNPFGTPSTTTGLNIDSNHVTTLKFQI